MKRPLGVFSIAVLTLLASLALAYFDLLLTLLYFVGGEFSTEPGTLAAVLWTELPLIALTLYAFILSIGLLVLRSRIVYYSAIVFWAVLTPLFADWGYSQTWRNIGTLIAQINKPFGYYGLADIILSMVPLAYSIGCLTYFNTSKVKNYFKMNQA